MRSRILLPVFIIISFVPILNSQGNFWTELVHGLPGGLDNIRLTDSNGWLYAYKNSSRLYRSVDEGQSWQLIYEEATHLRKFDNFTFSRNGTIYAQEGVPGQPGFDYDIYRSTDGGNSWVLNDTSSFFQYRRESANGHIFAQILSNADTNDPQGIYRSNIGTNDWELILETGFQYVLQIDKFGHLQHGNLVSSDEGETWDTIGFDTSLYDNANAFFISQDKYLQILTGFDSTANSQINKLALGTLGDTTLIYVTPDPSTPSTSTYYKPPFLLNDNRILIVVNKKLYMSEDEGQSWNFITDQYNFSLPTYKPPVVLPVSGKIIGHVDGDIKASSDDGSTWTPSYDGINENFGNGFTVTENPKTIWANSSNGLFKSPVNGISWSNVSVQVDSTQVEKITNYSIGSNGEIYAIADYQFYISYDNGAQFTHLATPDSLHSRYLPKLKGTDTLFINSNNGLLRFDGVNNLIESMNTSDVCKKIMHHPSGDIYGIFKDTTVFQLKVSDDRGLNWSLVNSPLDMSSSASIYQGVVFEIDSKGVIFIGDDKNVYRTEDLGNSWTPILSISGSASISDSKMNSDGHLFISIYDLLNSRMLRSNNKGDNWTTIPWIENPYNSFYPPWIFYENNITIDQEGYLYMYVYFIIGGQPGIFKSAHPTTNGAYLLGNASKSLDDDCTTFDPEFPMEDIIIKAEGNEIWYTHTDTLVGDYEMYIDTGMYEVTAVPPLPFFWDTCTTSAHLPLNGDTTWADFSVPSLGDCPFITIDLATPFLERCFEQDIYIQYCNHGTIDADSVILYIEIDSFLTMTDTSLNWQPVPDTTNIFMLTLPALDVNECQTISTPVLVSCEAELGQLHCITVNGWPNLICTTPSGWSGAEIEASAACEDTTVILQLENIGTAPSQPLEFVIVEDDVVLLTGQDDYDIAEAVAFAYPSNGNYYRIESEQEPGHPFPGPVAAWEVGCNGDGTPFVHFIEQFPLGDEFGSEDSNCANNAGSFDPNDKQGSPIGFGPGHLIKPGNDIEYLIRFQNTGTALAHNVVIRDTLSPFLNPESVRVGAASHPYSWDFVEGNILTFKFDDINLIDSMTNEPESHGFISFKVSHHADLPLGTVIPNRAAIYFDFNLPIITNTTFHQLGEDFLEIISSDKEENNGYSDGLAVYPNPAFRKVFVQLPYSCSQLQIFDMQGRLIQLKEIEGGRQTAIIGRKALPDGIYFIRAINSQGKELGTTKLVFD